MVQSDTRVGILGEFVYVSFRANCPVGRGHSIHFCRAVRHHPNKRPGYVTKPSGGETPDLKVWLMWSTFSLPFLPGPL